MTRSDAKRKAAERTQHILWLTKYDGKAMRQLLLGLAPTPASRHCEVRSNPDSKSLVRSLDCFVVPPRNDAKRRKREAAEKTTKKGDTPKKHVSTKLTPLT